LNEVCNKTRNDLYPGSRVLEVESEDTNKKLGEDLNYNVNKEIENIEHGRKEISTRSKTRNNKVKFHELSYLEIPKNNFEDINDPVRFDEDWNHKDKNERLKWRISIKEELDEILKKKVWTEIEDNGQKTIGLRWVFKIKNDGRYRSRLVALGYKQEYGYNYDQTYSPIMKDISFKLIILMTLKKSWTLNKVDIKTAFLNTQLDEEVFISLPSGI